MRRTPLTLRVLSVPGALTVAAGLTLAGCGSSTAEQPAPSQSAASQPASSPAAAGEDDLLARHELAGLDTREVIAKLEASQDDRENGPMGSVKATEVVLTDDQGETTLPIPDGQFYLSVAPYENRTHDCFNHNLATCQGELTGTPVHVKVTDETGKAVLDEQVTTGDNGFAGVWLPRDIKGTITVEADGKTASQPIGTGPEDPTCLTTLKLT